MQQILCEYKLKALLYHPDKNQENCKQVEDQFRKLQKAKDVLTDADMRKCYDKWRSAGISMPFERWSKLAQNVHHSMHWTNRRQNDLMIECQQNAAHSHKSEVQQNSCHEKSFVWERVEPDVLLSKFRNYEI